MLRKKIAALVAISTLAFPLAACGDDEKPSKAEVNKGLTKILSSHPLTPKRSHAAANKHMACTTNEIYGKMSEDSLKAIAGGERNLEVRQGKEEQFERDKKILAKAITKCAAKFSKGLSQAK